MARLHEKPALTSHILGTDLIHVEQDPLTSQLDKKAPWNSPHLAANDSLQGLVELATAAEAQAGTDTERAVTPAGVAAAIGYTEYVALVTQVGTGTPTATIIKNDTGATVVLAYVTVGWYSLTFSSAVLTANKSLAIISGGNPLRVYMAVVGSTSLVYLITANQSGAETDGVLSATPVVIRVYV